MPSAAWRPLPTSHSRQQTAYLERGRVVLILDVSNQQKPKTSRVELQKRGGLTSRVGAVALSPDSLKDGDQQRSTTCCTRIRLEEFDYETRYSVVD